MLTDPTAVVPGKVGTYHPQTSHDAALANAPRFGTQRYAALSVLHAAWPGALTVAQVTEAMGMRSRNQAATRVMELREGGWVERVIDPRTNAWVTRPTGPAADGVLHRITPTGRRQFPTIRRPTVIYVDRMKLRQYLNEAPLKVKEAVAAALTGRPPLSADSYDDEPQALYDATLDAINAASAAGFTLGLPVDTEPYRAQLFELPADLMDVAQAEARTYSVPNLAHAGQWTPEHADTVSALLSRLTEEAETRRKRVHALLGEVALNEDHVRHAIIKQLTGDRAESSTALTAPEVDALDGWVQAVKVDRVEFHLPTMKLADAKTGEVLPPYQCDWRSFAKAKGMTTTHLSKLARGAAELLGMPAPAKAADVTDFRLTAALWRLVDTEVALGRLGGTEEEPTPPPEAPQAPEPAAGSQVQGQAASAAPGGPVGPVMAPGDRGSLVVMLPVPLGQLRQVLDVLGL